IIGIIAVVIIPILVYQSFNKPKEQTQQVAQEQPTTAIQTTTASPYKDGTYSVDGNYTTPDGPESIGVTVTLKNGIVTDTSLTEHPRHPQSFQFEGIFADNYKPLVVGKDI